MNPADGSVLLWVPGVRDLTLGSTSGMPNERPLQQIEALAGLFVGKCEVTWTQYERFCRRTGHLPPLPRITVGEQSFRAGPQHPVFNLSPLDALAYARWAGLRLPEELEWAYAARGTDQRLYPWGNAPLDPTRANAWDRSSPWEWGEEVKASYLSEFGQPLVRLPEDGFPFTAPVGSFPAGASPFGCLDMAGNVWEWVINGDHEFVRRGGAWSSTGGCRATYVSSPPNQVIGGSRETGFRLAISPERPSAFPQLVRFGETLNREAAWEQARLALELARSMEGEPEHARAFLNLAVTHLGQDRVQEARVVVQEGLAAAGSAAIRPQLLQLLRQVEGRLRRR